MDHLDYHAEGLYDRSLYLALSLDQESSQNACLVGWVGTDFVCHSLANRHQAYSTNSCLTIYIFLENENRDVSTLYERFKVVEQALAQKMVW